MTVEVLINKLEKLTDNIEDMDIIKDFPTILNGLDFILFEGKTYIDNLSVGDRQDNILDIMYLKIKFFAEIVKKYLELNTSDEYKYVIEDFYNNGGTSEYDARNDIVRFSTIGMTFHSISDTDIIKTIFHEFRHQRQNHFSKITDFKDLLNYPNIFIRLIKNKMPKEIYEIVDKEDRVLSSKYYTDNYERMYVEIDADLMGLYFPKKMINYLYDLYPSHNEEYDEKVYRIQNFLLEETYKVEEKLRNENKLNNPYKGEVIRANMITSDIIYKGKERDSLLFIDKAVKDNIDRVYPVLNLFINKNYIELIRDRNNYINELGNKDKINSIYDYYIKSDPILMVSQYIVNNDIENLIIFLRGHPTFTKEYKEEIIDMINLLGVDSSIIDLLVEKEIKEKNLIIN